MHVSHAKRMSERISGLCGKGGKENAYQGSSSLQIEPGVSKTLYSKAIVEWLKLGKGDGEPQQV
jgi:hypothetical protein